MTSQLSVDDYRSSFYRDIATGVRDDFKYVTSLEFYKLAYDAKSTFGRDVPIRIRIDGGSKDDLLSGVFVITIGNGESCNHLRTIGNHTNEFVPLSTAAHELLWLCNNPDMVRKSKSTFTFLVGDRHRLAWNDVLVDPDVELFDYLFNAKRVQNPSMQWEFSFMAELEKYVEDLGQAVPWPSAAVVRSFDNELDQDGGQSVDTLAKGHNSHLSSEALLLIGGRHTQTSVGLGEAFRAIANENGLWKGGVAVGDGERRISPGVFAIDDLTSVDASGAIEILPSMSGFLRSKGNRRMISAVAETPVNKVMKIRNGELEGLTPHHAMQTIKKLVGPLEEKVRQIADCASRRNTAGPLVREARTLDSKGKRHRAKMPSYLPPSAPVSARQYFELVSNATHFWVTRAGLGCAMLRANGIEKGLAADTEALSRDVVDWYEKAAAIGRTTPAANVRVQLETTGLTVVHNRSLLSRLTSPTVDL